MRSIVVLFMFAATAVSQEPYKIPFASKGNALELTVANTSPVVVSRVTIQAEESPSWLSFSQKTFTIDQLEGKEEKTATFSFSVDKLAPVNKEARLTFAIKSNSGEMWSKDIKIKIAPPEKFELFQNYPNPFNPNTTICYQLSADSKVNLKIYDLLGRDVATLVDDEELAGYHQEVLNGGHLASGMYVYRIVYTEEAGKQSSARKTMLLVK